MKGFTLIELMIAIAIVGIVIAAVFGQSTKSTNVQYGFNGVTETRCIEGFKFVVGHDGNAHQIMDEAGKGVRCN